MKWYFAINSASLGRYRDLIRVAVRTALDNTDLEPNLIFDGAPCEFTDRLRSDGVTVHFRQSSFSHELDIRAEEDGYRASTARGAYLRLEIPLIENRNDFILYTDVDVMFLGNYDWSSLRPDVVMASGEYDSSQATLRQSTSVFNSGVMVINVPKLRTLLPDFIEFIRSRKFYFHGEGGFYDQGAINLFLAGRIEPLPNELNYRIFSGDQWNPTIAHFHGPKPHDIERCIMADQTVYPVIRELYARNPGGYKRYLDLFNRKLS